MTPIVVKLKVFAIQNPQGGTIISNMACFPKFTGIAEVIADSGFWDYETGWRFRGTAHSPDLIAYQTQHGGEDKRVFFSQFDLTDRLAGDQLANQLGLSKPAH